MFFCVPGLYLEAYIWRGLYMEGPIFGILRYFNSRRKFTRVGLLVIELVFSFQVSQSLQESKPFVPLLFIKLSVKALSIC